MLFAGSFMVGANALARSLPLPSDVQEVLLELVNGSSTASLLLVGLLTVGFARLYVNVASDPLDGANTMTRSGRFMRGAAPGVETARRIAVMNNASGWSYALVLLPVVMAPVLMQLLSGQNVPVGVSGAALVIPTLVAAEIVSSWVRPRRT
jgi:preprotein translocase subunit SecY